jgi:hypothetical protein
VKAAGKPVHIPFNAGAIASVGLAPPVTLNVALFENRVRQALFAMQRYRALFKVAATPFTVSVLVVGLSN